MTEAMRTAEAARSFHSHPAASIFPLMSGAELAALAEDIRKNGQQDPIVLADGAILDGRNRWLACEIADVQPVTVRWDHVSSPLDFVVSRNLHRRHLNLSQRAMIACEIANARVGHPWSESNRIFIPDCNVTAEQAAKMLGVSRALVIRAKTIWQRGTAEEIAAVRSGNAKVSATVYKIWQREKPRPPEPAQIIQFPHPRQRHPIKLPNGENPEAVARQALELHKRLGSAEKVAQHLGIRVARCRRMMDIVLIADRKDLSPHDAAIAGAALQAMNGQLVPLAAVCETLLPITRRLWGDRKGTSRAARENNRSERFEHGIGILIQSCLNGSKIDLPHLAPERARNVLTELRDAIESIRVLMARIERIHQ